MSQKNWRKNRKCLTTQMFDVYIIMQVVHWVSDDYRWMKENLIIIALPFVSRVHVPLTHFTFRYHFGIQGWCPNMQVLMRGSHCTLCTKSIRIVERKPALGESTTSQNQPQHQTPSALAVALSSVAAIRTWWLTTHSLPHSLVQQMPRESSWNLALGNWRYGCGGDHGNSALQITR